MKKNKVIMLLLLVVFLCGNKLIANSNVEYTLTGFMSHDSGNCWKYVLVNKNIRTSEVNKIAKELHKKYPKNCFRFYSDLNTLKKMYKYDSTNSYVTKKAPYPEQAFNKYNRGIVNIQYGLGWVYTTENYESIKL